jgi:replicative DNA helicase
VPNVEWKTWDKVLSNRAVQHEQIAIKRAEGKLRPEDLYIPTGIRRWDNNGGTTRGVLTVLGGVDGQGKSVVRGHLAQAAARCGLHVAEIVMEDPEAATADRSIANATGLDSRKLGLGTFDVMDLDKIYAAAREAESWGKYVHYYSGLLSADSVLGGISDLADSLEAQGETLGLVLVDYAQAFPEDDKGLESVIRHFSWDANKLAQELNCGFVAFSQVKPEISARGHGVFWASRKKDPDSWDVSGFMPGPGTQDLAWASAFGQRGRDVGYIFRPGFYERMLGKPGAVDDRLFIRWAKVNFGNSGLLELRFDGKTSRIYE